MIHTLPICWTPNTIACSFCIAVTLPPAYPPNHMATIAPVCLLPHLWFTNISRAVSPVGWPTPSGSPSPSNNNTGSATLLPGRNLWWWCTKNRSGRLPFEWAAFVGALLAFLSGYRWCHSSCNHVGCHHSNYDCRWWCQKIAKRSRSLWLCL